MTKGQVQKWIKTYIVEHVENHLHKIHHRVPYSVKRYFQSEIDRIQEYIAPKQNYPVQDSLASIIELGSRRGRPYALRDRIEHRMKKALRFEETEPAESRIYTNGEISHVINLTFRTIISQQNNRVKAHPAIDTDYKEIVDLAGKETRLVLIENHRGEWRLTTCNLLEIPANKILVVTKYEIDTTHNIKDIIGTLHDKPKDFVLGKG